LCPSVRQLLTEEGRCMRCFTTAHATDECNRARPCTNCKNDHHTALCPDAKHVKMSCAIVSSVPTKESDEDENDREEYDKNGHLMTATIWLEGQRGSKQVLCLIDQGAMRTFIHSDIPQQLGLETVCEEKMVMQAFGSEASKESTVTSHLVKFKGSFPGAKTIEFEALAKESICGESIYQKSQLAIELQEKGFTLADDRVLSSKPVARKVGLIIGADHYWKVVEEGNITSKCGLRAVPSKLGWLISGRPKNLPKINGSNVTAALMNVISRDKPKQESAVVKPTFTWAQNNPAIDSQFNSVAKTEIKISLEETVEFKRLR